MHKKLVWLLGFVAFLNIFLFHRFGGVATALLFVSYFTFLNGIFWDKEYFRKNLKLMIGEWIVVLLFSFGTILLPNPFAMFNLIVGLFLVTNFSGYLLACKKSFFEGIDELVLTPVYLTVSYLLGCIKTVEEIFNFKGPKTDFKKAFPFLRGLAISVPIVLILVGLLSSGDLAFSYYTQRFWQEVGKFFSPDLVVRTIFSLFILGLFSPLIFIKIKDFLGNYVPKSIPFVTEIEVLLASASIVLGAFLFTQWKYVFVNLPETALKRFGVATFSEYVTRGFFEFILVAGLVYVLYWVGLGAYQKNKDKFLLILQSILGLEFVVFIISVLRRIALYQQFHGWSLIRFYGGIFLLLVAALFVFVAARHVVKRKMVYLEVGAILVVMGFIGFFNLENYIATVSPPTVNKKIDYVYLSRMSSSGVAGWQMAFDHSQKVLRDESLLATKSINKDERLEIAYTALENSNLIKNYAELVKYYGTDDERKDFLVRIIKQYQWGVDLRLADVKRSVTAPNTNWPDVVSSVEKEQVVFADYLKNVESDPVYSLWFFNERYQDREFMVYKDMFNNGIQYHLVSDIDGQKFMKYSRIAKFNGQVKSDFQTEYGRTYGYLGKVLNFSYSDYLAFQKMKKDMPIGNLLDAEQQYFLIRRKIIQEPAPGKEQPLPDHSIDVDVSFNSPLL